MFKFKKYLADAIFSFPCPGCGQQSPGLSHNKLCSTCCEQIKFIKHPACPGCGGEIDGVLELCAKCLKEDPRPWTNAFSLFDLSGFGQDFVQSFKYNNRPELARALGELLSEHLKEQFDDKYWLVPVPLHWSRYLQRGYNQSRLVCRIISARTGITLNDIMKRNIRTRQQAKLNRKARKRNLTNAFSLKKGVICKNRTILLFDDVLTTGATLTAAAKILLDAGAAEVYVMTVGRR